ncbi:MAG: putative membrane protein [Pelotomaculum thermopropionicum]|uniref:Putative membrane protein n=1 Tax=Pelotomaculum thermopropionicum TaxID=110500 RepID=A0A101HUS1_9FIRM|nr:MAG: putative membrane protein [Pelotomaculum thermopropionicum]
MGKKVDKKIYLAGLIVFLMAVCGFAFKGYLWGAAPGLNGPDKTAPGEPASVSETTYPPMETGAETGEDSESRQQETEVEGTGGLRETAGNLSNEKYGWGLKRNSNHLQPEMPSYITAGLKKYDAYWVGSPDEKAVYLTFDEGYENGYTPKILDALKANNVKAAFFVTGHYLETQPELVKRMVDEGHIVGNHTAGHPSLPGISDEQIKEELRAVEAKFEAVTGRKEMKYLRPPKGEYSERTLAVTRELGYHNIFWSLAMVDWIPMPGGAEESCRTVMDNLHNGALILLHAVSEDNAAAMDRILKGVKAQGYAFKTLDDLAKN